MASLGSVTVDEVAAALEAFGGEAEWEDILDTVIKNRGDALPENYSSERSFHNTIFQLIQRHCREYRKYKGPELFKKIDGSTSRFRLIGFHSTKPINDLGIDAFQSSLPIKKGVSEQQFREIQQQRIEVGREGEEFVVQHEKDYLISINRHDLAQQVERVSEKDIGLGYDILSFDETGNEKYIEVKATTTDSSTFELTANELSTAKSLGPKYWLYFVRQLRNDPRLTKIQDIASQVDQKFILEPSAYKARLIQDVEP